MQPEISIANTDADIAACYPVMSELRPHLAESDFLPLVRRLGDKTGLRLAFLSDGGIIKSVAGFRISEWLAGGQYLEIEDLVSKTGERSRGHGAALFGWLKNHAAQNGCAHVRLVSNVRRQDAHRFYIRMGMSLEAHYFSLNVS